MAIDDVVRTALMADAAFVALLTGGVYTWNVTGKLFISRDNSATSTAFDANGVLKPCCMVKVRSATPTNTLSDPLPLQGERLALEIWFYQDDGYATIESAKQRAFVLLHEACLENYTLFSNGTPFLRTYTEEDFGGAFLIRADYRAHRINRGG